MGGTLVLTAISRWKGISARWHSVGITNLSAAIVDHSLTASCVLEDLPSAIDRLGLGRMMGACPLGAWLSDIPASVGAGNDVTSITHYLLLDFLVQPTDNVGVMSLIHDIGASRK